MVMRVLLLNNLERIDSNSSLNTPVNMPLVCFKVPDGSVFLVLSSQQKMTPSYMEN